MGTGVLKQNLHLLLMKNGLYLFPFIKGTFLLLFQCGGKHDPDKQIMCDECDMAYHIGCLNPPLEKIPEDDEWYDVRLNLFAIVFLILQYLSPWCIVCIKRAFLYFKPPWIWDFEGQ